MRSLSVVLALLLSLSATASELLNFKPDQLDKTGKPTGFQIFKASVENLNGKNTIVLDLEKGNFVTIPVSLKDTGDYLFSGFCSGDANELYAKITINGKVYSRSIRKKYMTQTAGNVYGFKLEFKDVPSGNGVLFIAPRGGKQGKLHLNSISLKFKQSRQKTKIRAVIHPVPEIIDSDKERIGKSAALNIAHDWEIRHPEDKRLKILPPDQTEPGALNVLFDTHTGKLEKKYFPYNFRTGRLTCRLDRYIDLAPEIWTQYNQISVMVKPLCNHDRSHLWFDVMGIGIQSAVPMQGGKWNKISINWSSAAPEKARKITGISLGFGGFGTPAGEQRYTRFLFKDFKLENVITGTQNTWEVSPEKIVIPQTGFAPGENKKALFSASHKAGDFALVSGNKKVFSGKLITKKFTSGTFKIADFSQFRTPGKYRIISGNLRSVEFPVGYYHLKEAAAKSRYFMNCMRLGGTTPLFPDKAQLADDARRSDNGKTVNVSGGWCDAADLCGFHAMAATTITRPLAWSLYRFNIPEMQSETFWGGKLLNKLFDEETGLPYTVMCHFGIYRTVNNIDRKNPDPKTLDIIRNNGEWTMNKYFTDGIPGTGDERAIHFAKADGAVSPHDRADFHYGMTAAGHWIYLVSGKSKMFEKAFQNSRRHFEHLEHSTPQKLKADGIIPFDRNFTKMELFRLESNLALYLATGKVEYRKKSSELVDKLLKKQERLLYATEHGRLTGWFNFYRPRSASFEKGLTVGNALSLYAQTCTDKAQYLKIAASLRIYADGFAANREARVQPYNMIYPILSKRPVKNWSGRAVAVHNNTKLYANFRKIFLSDATGELALDALATATFLRDLRLQYAASELLRYHLGENQSARSLMTDVGSNFNRQLMSTNFGWIPGMMGNPEIADGVAKLPYNRNCGRYEVYTQAQGGFTAALTVLSSDARLTFPGRKHITASDTITGAVYTGNKGILSIPGGTVYRMKIENLPAFELPVISGEKKEIVFDGNKPYISSLKKSGEKLIVKIINPAAKTVSVQLNTYLENAAAAGTQVTLKPNRTHTVEIPYTIQKPGHAAVCVLYLDENFKNPASIML